MLYLSGILERHMECLTHSRHSMSYVALAHTIAGPASAVWLGQNVLMTFCIGIRSSRAFTGTYIDKKCPFTGNVSIRGRILAGVVKSTKMNRTIIVRRNYFHYIKKYQR
jgi:hypothetical protein